MCASSGWTKPSFSKLSDWVSNFFKGALIGAADIVPGISGGTVAFIIGVYEDLLFSLATFNKENFRLLLCGRPRIFFSQVSWKFLLSLFAGIVASFLLFAKCITFLLNDEVYRIYLYSLFFGLVIGSAIFCFKRLRLLHAGLFASLCIGGLIAFFLTRADLATFFAEPRYDVPFRHEQFTVHDLELIEAKKCVNIDAEREFVLKVPLSSIHAMLANNWILSTNVIYDSTTGAAFQVDDVLQGHDSPLLDIWVVVCGMVAVSAMLLPGISGSYMLTILGMYGTVLGALIDFVSHVRSGLLDWPAFRICLSMAIGIVFGALIFSRCITYFLKRYHDVTLSLLIGFMIGALPAVWPFWSYEYAVDPARLLDGPRLKAIAPILPCFTSDLFYLSCGIVLFGVVLVIVIESVSAKDR